MFYFCLGIASISFGFDLVLTQESLMMDKIGDDVVCTDMTFAPITVGGRGGKAKQMQALLQLLQVI